MEVSSEKKSVRRESVTLDHLIDDMGGNESSEYWQDTIYEEDEPPTPRLNQNPVLEKKEITDLSTQGHMVIDEKKEEDELHYYRNKIEEKSKPLEKFSGISNLCLEDLK